MGYINLSIKRDGVTYTYVIFHAKYLNEAWLAEVQEDDTTKIVKQFKCRKFKNCFYDLARHINMLGQVEKLSATDIEPRFVKMLENILVNKSHHIPQVNVFSRHTFLYYKTMWNWFLIPSHNHPQTN